MDVVELKIPPAIATCSLDHSIKIWNLSNGDELGCLTPSHLSGVRSLDYTQDFSGTIISVAHENQIKVWSPEVSITQAYVGNLEGHNTVVKSAKFIQRTPYAVSVDEKLNIRVWDIRSLTCIQILAQDKKKLECNGLCMFGLQKKFALFGRRLLLFDSNDDSKGDKAVKSTTDAYPIQAEFNNYYNTLIVATK